MTFNAASRLRSLEDRSAALGSSRCELPVMHSVPKSAVLPYASGVGDLSRRLLNRLQRLEYGHRTMCDGFPSFLGFGVGGRSYSNFLASTVARSTQSFQKPSSKEIKLSRQY